MNQLAMDWPITPSYAPQDFIVGACNQLAYDTLMNWPHWPAFATVLYGAPASGKTHLAHVWAAHASAPIVDGATVESFAPEAWTARAYALDNLHDCPSDEALFHLLNHAKSADISLLLIDHCAPNQKDVRLPDLASRLRALPAVAIDSPDDALLKQLMMKLGADRQLSLSGEVLDYMIKRIDRRFDHVAHIIARLDSAALTHQRAITIPFAKTILNFPN